jgi:integrase
VIVGTVSARYHAGVASIRRRSGSWNVYWRRGGRGGKTQSTTWADRDDALHAKAIAEQAGHDISDVDVEKAILGTNEPAPDNSGPTVAEWAARWLKARTRITPGTKAGYRRQLDNVILPAIGHLPLEEVTGEIIANLLNRLLRQRSRRSRHLTNATATRYYSLIHAMFQAAVRDKLLDDNPAQRTDFIRDLVRHDRVGDDGHVYLAPQEVDMIRAHMRPDTLPLFEFLVGTGARIAEATAVAPQAVRLFDGQREVAIERAWKRPGAPDDADDEDGDDLDEAPPGPSVDGSGWYLGTTKGRANRTVSIDEDLVDVLAPLLADPDRGDFLFQAPRGGPVVYANFYERRWLPAVEAAMRCVLHPPPLRGKPTPVGDLAGPLCGDNGGTRNDAGRCGAKVMDGWDRCRAHVGPPPGAVSGCRCPTRLRRRPRPHDLRHTHAAWLFAAGRPPLEISRRLGHKQLATTSEIYGGLMPNTDSQSAAAILAAKRSATGGDRRCRTGEMAGDAAPSGTVGLPAGGR